MRKCAIIGSNGYVGRHIHWYLRNMKIEADRYDIQESDSITGFTQLDLTNKSELDKIDLNVDYIFYFAGLTGTHAGFDMYDKYISINEIGLLNLLDAVRNSEYRPRIIFPSTRLVYKGMDMPLKETDEKETKTIYAVNKLACEGILQAYNKSFDIPYTIFRVCIPYGNVFDTKYSYGLIGFFENMASTGKDITLYGGGDLKRTFTYIEDLCYQIVEGAFLEQSCNEIYNIGGLTHTLRDIALFVASKYKTGVVSLPWPDKDLRVESGHTYFDDAKIQKLLGEIQYKEIVNR